MKTVRWFCALALAVVAAPAVSAQPELPKPGPEHEMLKKMEGTWDLTMKFGGGESKGTVTYKMDLGGLWLTGSLESELFGAKFQGKSIDGYDATRKKYVGVWVDSMSNSPMLMEGTFDKEKKTLTMTGDGPGMDGTTIKMKNVTTWTSADSMTFELFVILPDGKEMKNMTIVYTRRAEKQAGSARSKQ